MLVEFVAGHQVDQGVGLLGDVFFEGDRVALCIFFAGRAIGRAIDIALPIDGSAHGHGVPLAGQAIGAGDLEQIQRRRSIHALACSVARMGVGVAGDHVPVTHDLTGQFDLKAIDFVALATGFVILLAFGATWH